MDFIVLKYYLLKLIIEVDLIIQKSKWFLVHESPYILIDVR